MQYLIMLRRYNEDECVPAYMRNDALGHRDQMLAEFNEADPALNLTVLGHMGNGDDAGTTFTYMATFDHPYTGDDMAVVNDYLQSLYDQNGIAGRFIVMGRGENIVPVHPHRPGFTPPYAWGCANDAEFPHAWVSLDEVKIYQFPVNMEEDAERVSDKLNEQAYLSYKAGRDAVA